jgi:sensor histidine kinase YesM
MVQGFEPPPERVVFFVLLNLLLVASFYFNYYFLIPRFLLKGKRWQYFLLVLGVYLFLLSNIIGLQYWMIQHNPQIPAAAFQIFQRLGWFASMIMYSLVWASSSGMRLNAEWIRSEARRTESDRARLQAELSELKSQLNPHFLFNTLNGIYTLTLSKSDLAPGAVLQLSHLLRYVMSEANADFVPLEKDLEHMQHFVRLHTLRLTDKTPLNFEINGLVKNQTIAPLLLLPFVENAFKYGISTQETAPIMIRVDVLDQQLTFHCANKIVRRQSMEGEQTGIGIANTRKRLQLLYPEQHQLDIWEKDGFYHVTLKLKR